MKILAAIAFWFAVSAAAVALSGLYAWMDSGEPVTALWRSA